MISATMYRTRRTYEATPKGYFNIIDRLQNFQILKLIFPLSFFLDVHAHSDHALGTRWDNRVSNRDCCLPY